MRRRLETYDPWNASTASIIDSMQIRRSGVPAGLERLSPGAVADSLRRESFLRNLRKSTASSTNTLQGRLAAEYAASGVSRSTARIGIGGLFDFATKFSPRHAAHGLRQNIVQMGHASGSVPGHSFFGPSTLREGVGLLGDYGTSYGINLANLYRGNQSWGLGVLNAVDKRSNISFRYYSTGSPFEYETIRFLYVRKLLLEDEGLHKKDPRKPARRMRRRDITAANIAATMCEMAHGSSPRLANRDPAPVSSLRDHASGIVATARYCALVLRARRPGADHARRHLELGCCAAGAPIATARAWARRRPCWQPYSAWRFPSLPRRPSSACRSSDDGQSSSIRGNHPLQAGGPE